MDSNLWRYREAAGQYHCLPAVGFSRTSPYPPGFQAGTPGVLRTGIRASSISDYLNNRYEPKQDKIYLIAEALSVNPGWLSGRDDSSAILKTDPFALKNIVPIEKHMVPIIGQIAAGEPILADEHIETYLPCDAGVQADSGSS